MKEKIIWQKCPVCDGRKEINAVLDYPIYGQIPCPACEGKGILDQFGRPALFKDWYPKEFLEWIIFDDNSPFYFEKHKGKNMYWHKELDKYFNLDYVYDFWQNNIKDK